MAYTNVINFCYVDTIGRAPGVSEPPGKLEEEHNHPRINIINKPDNFSSRVTCQILKLDPVYHVGLNTISFDNLLCNAVTREHRGHVGLINFSAVYLLCGATLCY